MDKKMDETITKAEHLALLSLVSCLTRELSRSGAINLQKLQESVAGTAANHSLKGNEQVADALHLLNNYVEISVPSSSPLRCLLR